MDEAGRFKEMLLKYRIQILFALIGLALLALSIIILKREYFLGSEVEVISESPSPQASIFVEISGSVVKPGVYELPGDARVVDLINSAGGFSQGADISWVEKTINRAALLKDGQKFYIKSLDEQTSVLSANVDGQGVGQNQEAVSQNSSSININTASQKELESLWGIGPVTAQNIIEQRPYSVVDELLNKKIVKSNVFEKIKNQITVY